MSHRLNAQNNLNIPRLHTGNMAVDRATIANHFGTHSLDRVGTVKPSR